MELITPERSLLTPRWEQLRYHPVQNALYNTQSRFAVVPAGRRSGKTELLKRHVVRCALGETRYADAWYVLAAPTLNQARRIFWRDLKALIPKQFIMGKIRESELTIRLINGAEISVLGMDEASRAEGRALSGIGLDEYGNMKERIWTDNIRPALSDRQGWAWFTGVPEGRNHYWKLALRAQEEELEARQAGRVPRWAYYHWKSADILPAEEIEQARQDMDPLTFRQEYEADFITFEGAVYYCYNAAEHVEDHIRSQYNPILPLILTLDFNVKPGVGVILQELPYRGKNPKIPKADSGQTATHVLGEIYIEDNSNTQKVCEEFLRQFPNHKGEVHLYGDATGGARGTAQVAGSDWEIARKVLRSRCPGGLKTKVPDSNPRERARINSVNSRLKTVDGTIKSVFDRQYTPYLQRDLGGVTYKSDGSGEIDKKIAPQLTHISDGYGYYTAKRWPVDDKYATTTEEF